MKFDALTRFCAWLELTPPSQIIQSVSWIVPTVQTVHILAIAMVFASATMIALRLMGRIATDQPTRAVAARFLPFIWWPLLVLLATGIVMITGEPARSLANAVFQLKMLLLLGAIAATRYVQTTLDSDATHAPANGLQAQVKWFGVAALALWVGIIVAGRWIAYT